MQISLKDIPFLGYTQGCMPALAAECATCASKHAARAFANDYCRRDLSPLKPKTNRGTPVLPAEGVTRGGQHVERQHHALHVPCIQRCQHAPPVMQAANLVRLDACRRLKSENEALWVMLDCFTVGVKLADVPNLVPSTSWTCRHTGGADIMPQRCRGPGAPYHGNSRPEVLRQSRGGQARRQQLTA